MLVRELKFVAILAAASFLLASVTYEILRGGDYLAGVAALSLAILATILSALLIHYRRAIRVVLNPVSAEIASATPASLAGAESTVTMTAGAFAVVVMFGLIASGEVRTSIPYEGPKTASRYLFHGTGIITRMQDA